MLRTLFAAAAVAAAALPARAHFVFVVPDAKDPARAVVVLSEDLSPDEAVKVDKLLGLKVHARDAGGSDLPVEFKAGDHALSAAVPGSGPRVVYGSVNYGVVQRGEGKPYLLAYHPKAVIGAVPADKAAVGDKAVPVELVPVVAGGQVRFRFLSAGKPVADAEVTVMKPDGKDKVKTDADGLTPGFAAAGRYGAWAKATAPGAGEHDGKKYDEARHYATLVVDVAGK